MAIRRFSPVFTDANLNGVTTSSDTLSSEVLTPTRGCGFLCCLSCYKDDGESNDWTLTVQKSPDGVGFVNWRSSHVRGVGETVRFVFRLTSSYAHKVLFTPDNGEDFTVGLRLRSVWNSGY